MTKPDHKLPISVFIITKDEEDRIVPTLEAIAGLVSEVIVVDSGSTDDTVALAENYGARVIYNDWAGYGPQKRFAEEQCSQDWLFNLDGDEVVPEALADEIRQLFADGEPPHKAYSVPITEMFPTETKPHRFAFSLYPVRLYHKQAGRYSQSTVHDRVELADGVHPGQLKTRIHHRTVRSLSEEMVKLIEYSDLQNDDLEKKGRKISSARILTEFPLAFLKAYIGRRHFIRGFYGISTALNFAFYRHLRVAKHLERRIIKRQKQNRQR